MSATQKDRNSSYARNKGNQIKINKENRCKLTKDPFFKTHHNIIICRMCDRAIHLRWDQKKYVKYIERIDYLMMELNKKTTLQAAGVTVMFLLFFTALLCSAGFPG
jgi:hypothetical protein